MTPIPKPSNLFLASRRALAPAWLVCLALVLSSCRSFPHGNLQSSVPRGTQPQPTSEAEIMARASDHDVVPASDQHIEAATDTHVNVPAECVPFAGMPMAMTCDGPWKPPGIAGPWPHDEYLHDGGDRDVQANIGPNHEVRGLELEDTVAVYQTKDGHTNIEPSNRVCLYSPRFAAVRQVSGVVQNEQRDQPIGVERPVRPHLHQDDQLATTAVQPVQPEGEIGRKQPSIERVGESAVPATSRLPVMLLAGGFSPHEDFLAIRRGIISEAEKARLAEAVTAAIAWTHDQAVQVVLDGRQAVSITGEQKAQATFRVDEPDHPALRVLKVASTKVAKPGDIVDFTIRFDNLGDQAIKHVVLIDNLTTRLEYVPGTSQSSRPAEFSSEVNEGDSLVLTWDFADPLPAGAGGLVRFHCRVR